MKAEHRKELDTNLLADRVGKAVQRVKGSPRRAVFYYFLAAAAIVLVGGFIYRSIRQGYETTASQWISFDDGSRGNIRALSQDLDTNVGKAAAFQICWYLYWEEGVKFLGSNPRGGLLGVSEAAKIYSLLAEKCKGDALFEPQAMLGLAVCEETLAIQDRARLKRAAELYDALVQHEQYKSTAEGKFAQDRLEKLRDSKGNIRAEVTNFYADLQPMLNVPNLEAPREFPGLPPLDLPPPPKKE